MNDDLSGFNDWSQAFAEWQDVSISELHGIMTALMTVCTPPDGDGWRLLLSELSFAEPSDDALTLLTEYAEDTSHMLSDNEDAYEFAPLVPDDEHELTERLFALKDWAGGFLTGVGVAELNFNKDEGELLTDLAKIAGMAVETEEQAADNALLDADELAEMSDEMSDEWLDDTDSDEQQAAAEEEYLQLYEFARMLPVSLNRKNRKSIKDLSIIKGLSPERLTAQEIKTTATKPTKSITAESQTLPPVLDVMKKQ
ncbi:MAG: UPF0149 family protein [Moraxella sp.]|nr:UPF0149 family protein [Moraxella sp.]